MTFPNAAFNESEESRILAKYGMRAVAIFYLHRNEPLLRRIARVMKAICEECPLPAYQDGLLPPALALTLPEDDENNRGIKGQNFSLACNHEAFSQFLSTLSDPRELNVLKKVRRDLQSYRLTGPDADLFPARYATDGLHWINNYPRILKEGLSGYRLRIKEKLDTAETIDARMFYEALLEAADGLISLARRYAKHLRGLNEQAPSPSLARMAEAMERVPEHPAQSFYEAIVEVDWMLNFSLEPGRMDQYLFPYYSQDLAEGRISPEEAGRLLEEHLRKIDALIPSGQVVHMTIGGTDAEGKAAYNDLTAMILKTMRNLRQPNASLRVRRDMPSELWDTALEGFRQGSSNPSFVHEEMYREGLHSTAGVSKEDMADYCFGGCAETMVQGKSCVDSTWAVYNLPDILRESLATHLLCSSSFAEFFQVFQDDIRLTLREMIDQVNLRQHRRGTYDAFLLRTLFTDDCIERGLSFFAGGARYNFDIVSIIGIGNAVNSLIAVHALYDGHLNQSREEFLAMLGKNYDGMETAKTILRNLERYGNDGTNSNEFAAALGQCVFQEIRRYRCWRGNGHFLPASIAFRFHESFGQTTEATPDGRSSGELLADSCGAVQGTERKGPTAVMLSAARLPQRLAVGTCVLNLTLDRSCFETSAVRANVSALLRTYFDRGGTYVQITSLSEGLLEEAERHPEKHRTLKVRIAGYSDYFTTQPPAIREGIMKRVRYSAGK